MICVPSTLIGVVAGAVVSMFLGKNLPDDAEYQARLRAGQVPPPKLITDHPTLKPKAKVSAYVFLCGVALVVLFGFFPDLRTIPGAKAPLDMPIVIEIVMMSAAACMLALTKVPVDEVPKTATLRAGVVAVIGIFGLAWLGDSFISANNGVIVPAIGAWAQAAPWTFAFGLFFASVLLLYSQAAPDAARGRARHSAAVPDRDVPVGERLLLHPDLRVADRGDQLRPSGTTRIGRYVLNHSFMIPGLVATAVAVTSGLLIAQAIY